MLFSDNEITLGLGLFCFGFIFFLYCMDRACTTMNTRNKRKSNPFPPLDTAEYCPPQTGNGGYRPDPCQL